MSIKRRRMVVAATMTEVMHHENDCDDDHGDG